MNAQFACAARKVLTATLVGVALSTAAAAQEPRIGASARQQIEALMQEKASRTPAQRKISSNLLFAVRRQRGDAVAQALPGLRTSVRVDRTGRVLVDIRGEVSPGLLSRIVALGGSVASAFPQYGAVRASLPLGQVEALSSSSQVTSIRPAARPIAGKTNTSEGDVAHMADLARADLGADGSGAKVCVLSDSVDHLAEVQASGDLPEGIEILPGQDGVDLDSGPPNFEPTIGEGTAMLEVVHDLAPEADLGFATAWAGEASFAQNILDLRAAGCDVLVDDVLYVAEPIFQDGIIAQAVDLVVSDGAVYFSAAGNFGNLNDGTSSVWEGDFLGTGNPISSFGFNYDFSQDFGDGNALNTIAAESEYGYTLQWSDPQGASSNDFDLYLLDPDGLNVIDFSTNFQTGTQDPFEGIAAATAPDDYTGYHLVIARSKESAGRYLHLNALGGRLSVATAGQTWGHSAARGAFSVAAVDWFQGSAEPAPFTGAESIEAFGSDGPRRVFYESDGTPITAGDLSATGGELRQKPDLAAADGVSTVTPGFNPFYGSSAAAAHAAAIAGLMVSVNATLSEADVRDVFAGTALDIEAIGVDRDSGVGIVDAAAALGTLRSAVTTDFNADARSDILWRNTGTGSTVIWQMDGFVKEAAESIGAPNTSWVIEDVGDFDGDLRSDILWRNTDTGQTSVWMMDQFTKTSSGPIGTVGTVWAVAGLGDFDGDEHLDILWRHLADGNTIIWRMDGLTKLEAGSIGAPPPVWRISGVADFNGDGKADILWHNADTGSTRVWQMDGLAKTTAVGIGAPPPEWTIEGIADFDGGGQIDILWRHTGTGSTNIWQMNGYIKEAGAAIGTVSSAWTVARLGDFNGGGQSDILWRRPSDGSTVIWQMNGFVKEAAQGIGIVSNGWVVQ